MLDCYLLVSINLVSVMKLKEKVRFNLLVFEVSLKIGGWILWTFAMLGLGFWDC